MPCGIVRLEFSKGIVELRLQDGLQAHVNRQLNIHSMAGRLFLTSVDDDFAAGAVTFDVTKAIDPAKIILHASLNAFDPDDMIVVGIVAAQEAENMTQQRTIWISPRGILVEIKAAQ